MKFTRGAQKLLAVLLTGMALALVCFCFLYPNQNEAVAASQRELQLMKQQKKQLDRFAAAHFDTNKDSKQLEKQEKISGNLLPKQLNAAEFLTALQQWSRKSGVKVEKILPGEEKTYESYREQLITVTGKGTYFEWLDFLYLLEQDGRFIDIREMQGKTDSMGIFEGTIAVYIFASV